MSSGGMAMWVSGTPDRVEAGFFGAPRAFAQNRSVRRSPHESQCETESHVARSECIELYRIASPVSVRRGTFATGFHGTILLVTWVSWTSSGHTVRYSGACPGRYSGACPGRYSGACPGRYSGACPGRYSGACPGRHSGACPGRYSGALSGVSLFGCTGCWINRPRNQLRCFGSGCARPVATLKGAGEPHRTPALMAGIDAVPCASAKLLSAQSQLRRAVVDG